MKKNIWLASVVVVAVVAVGYFVMNSDSNQTGESAQTEQLGSTTPGTVVAGERTCSNIIATNEINAIFGVNNFTLQANSTNMLCIWAASGATNSWPQRDVLYLTLTFAKPGATTVQTMGSAAIQSGVNPVSGVANAYMLAGGDGMQMFKGDYMYSFRTIFNEDGSKYTAERIALAKLIDRKY